jgi:hypothetical protein
VNQSTSSQNSNPFQQNASPRMDRRKRTTSLNEILMLVEKGQQRRSQDVQNLLVKKVNDNEPLMPFDLDLAWDLPTPQKTYANS